MNDDAKKRLKAAKGNHAAAVRTAVRGLARANAHAEWLRDPKMEDFATDEDRGLADDAVRKLTVTVAELVLDAPDGTFTPDQLTAAQMEVR